MNLRHLKCFFWAAKLGNYTRAAEQLGVTQPAVFRAVQTLERAYPKFTTSWEREGKD